MSKGPQEQHAAHPPRGACGSPAGSPVTRVHPCGESAGTFFGEQLCHAPTVIPRESGGIHRSAVGKFTA